MYHVRKLNKANNGLFQQWSMLVLDVFSCHKTDYTKALLCQTNTNVIIIPGGVTSLLQPIYLSINKPFKDWLHRCCTDSIMSGVKTYTKSRGMRKVSTFR